MINDGLGEEMKRKERLEEDETSDLVDINWETFCFEGERNMLLFPTYSSAMPFDALVVILGLKRLLLASCGRRRLAIPCQ